MELLPTAIVEKIGNQMVATDHIRLGQAIKDHHTIGMGQRRIGVKLHLSGNTVLRAANKFLEKGKVNEKIMVGGPDFPDLWDDNIRNPDVRNDPRTKERIHHHGLVKDIGTDWECYQNPSSRPWPGMPFAE